MFDKRRIDPRALLEDLLKILLGDEALFGRRKKTEAFRLFRIAHDRPRLRFLDPSLQKAFVPEDRVDGLGNKFSIPGTDLFPVLVKIAREPSVRGHRVILDALPNFRGHTKL